ncbi:MAG: SPOR domain-containing protein [Sphingobacteriaceae bacterium]
MNPKVEEILNKKTALDKEKPVIAGYRLQLYFGGNRNEAAEIKARFASLYADYNAYLIYQQPYFKLRVGDFRNRITAGNFQKIILKDFPAVFIVKDDIAFPK